jgi:catechol 2,3-dioxygenase-like lactoylglutathione lyase family enzyme
LGRPAHHHLPNSLYQLLSQGALLRPGVLTMPARIQHVSIPFPPGGESAARAFYGELLELNEVPVPPSLSDYKIIWYRMGDTELHLFSEESREDTSGRHFCFALDSLAEVEVWREQLLAGGVEVKDVVAIPSRPRYVCRDPFQNLIEFTTIEYDYLQR